MRSYLAIICTLLLSANCTLALVARPFVPVTSSDFRKQEMGKKSALDKGYSLKTASDSKGVASISKVDLPKPLPTNHGLSMDHIFELQTLAFAMNVVKVDLSYYTDDNLTKIKNIINGPQNAVYIPEKLNGDKAAFIEKLQKDIFEKGDCTPIEIQPGVPNAEVIKYVQYTYSDASKVASDLQAILNIQSKTPKIDVKLVDIAAKLFKCLHAPATFTEFPTAHEINQIVLA